MTTALDQVRADAAAAATARDTYRAAMNSLRTSILAADRVSCGRNEIVRAAEGGMSRRKVYETLGAADLLSEVRAALGKRAVSVWAQGERVFLDLSPQIANGWEGPEHEHLTAEEREERDRSETRNLEESASGVLRALREAGLTFADEDAIEELVGFHQAEVVRIGAAS